MGLLDAIPGASGLTSKINVGGILSGLGKFALIVMVLAFFGGCMWYFFYKQSQKKLYSKRIYWFEEINGYTVPVGENRAAELTIPNTDVKVFYIKERDLYLPRPTIRVGKDSYWLGIKNNREVINFRMKNINNYEAGLEYDHTDQRYAKENLMELIKKNYKDKALVWWKEYKEVIALVVLVFVMSLSFFFIISKVGTLLDRAGTLIEAANNAVQSATAANTASGVTTVK